MVIPLKPGQVVRSLAGRDKGNFYLVIDVDGDYALVVDGDKRLIMKPKKKNCKHLQLFNYVDNELVEALKQNRVENALVRKILRSWREKRS
ncbi:MAG: hypothetical protein ACOYBM_07275 [Dethiobacteria bacterium]|jgi:large subunit ribosomal protein L14e|nr:hypothetical protein [Bacillota bacterium]